MRHKKILNIKTRIRKKRQLVIIEFDNPNEFVFLAPGNIKGSIGLEVYELELLIGSTMRIEFYKKGDKTFNGDVCKKDNIIVKDYFFELIKPVERLRVENAKQLLPFKKIKQIFYFNKFNKNSVGIKTIDEQVIFLSEKRFEAQSKLKKSEQHILVGSYIYPEFFKIGGTFPDGRPITLDNKFLRWINLRYADNNERMHEAFENGAGYFDGHEGYDPLSGYGDSYDQYGGPSDGYGGALDDDFINDALGGEVDAYWNID
jgi:hypothetical protein